MYGKDHSKQRLWENEIIMGNVTSKMIEWPCMGQCDGQHSGMTRNTSQWPEHSHY